MVQFTAIAPAAEAVAVGGQDVAVRGVSARGVAILLGRFPELRALLARQETAIGPERLLELVPDAVAAIVAAGIGHPGDPKAEAWAEILPVETQLDLLDAILRLTMPKGIGPFVERLAGLLGQLGVASPAPATPDTPSPGPSNT